jgi:flagellin
MRSSRERLSKYTTALGAGQSRLTVSLSNLAQSYENFHSAASQLLDADIATEAAELTKGTILRRAGAAVLAQANQQPVIALQLLGGIS